MEVYDLGAIVRAKRKEKGFTQKQLSELTGLSTSMISGIEAGYTKPSIDSLVSIALALSADMNELCGLAKPEHKHINCDGINDRDMGALQIIIEGLRNRK